MRIVKGISVGLHAFSNIAGVLETDGAMGRSKMGKLEFGYIRVHKVFWYS